MTLAPEWVRTNDPVIRSPARYRWTTAPAAAERVGNHGAGIWESKSNVYLQHDHTGSNRQLVGLLEFNVSLSQ